MPYTTVSTNQAMTSTFLNTNYRDQVVSTVTSGTRPAGTEGQVIYETDTDRVYVYNGSSWVEYGQVGAWLTWTPTLVQSGTVTATVTYASYCKIGRMVTAQAKLSVTGSGTSTNLVTVSTPTTAAASDLIVGSGLIYDASAVARIPGIARLQTTTTISLYDATQAPGNVLLGQTGTAFTAGLASSDVVFVSVVYESAS